MRLRPPSPSAVEQALRSHALALCQSRGWDPAACLLLIPLTPTRAPVRLLLGPDEHEGVVLRLALGTQQVVALRAAHAATTLLAERGIPVPRILGVTDNFAGLGATLSEREYVPGPTLGAAAKSPEHLAALASTLGRLHAQRSDTWGELRTPKRHGHFTATVGRLANALQALALHRDPASDHLGRRRVHRWARDWAPAFEAVRAFSLVHGDLAPEHVILTDGPRAVLLGVRALRWDVPALDLAALRCTAFGSDHAAWSRFLEEHRRHAGALVTDEALRLLPFAEVNHHVQRCAALLRAMRRAERPRLGPRGRRPHGGALGPEGLDQIRAHWQAALRVVETHSPPTGDRHS